MLTFTNNPDILALLRSVWPLSVLLLATTLFLTIFAYRNSDRTRVKIPILLLGGQAVVANFIASSSGLYAFAKAPGIFHDFLWSYLPIWFIVAFALLMLVSNSVPKFESNVSVVKRTIIETTIFTSIVLMATLFVAASSTN